MKRVLLTGGAGSIGYHVIREFFLATDWEIVCLDSFRHRGYHERIQALFDENPEWEKRLKVAQHDLVCPISEDIKTEIGDVNYILHLAAISDVFWGDQHRDYTFQNNLWSTWNMYQYAATIPHEAFIYFSTDEVYGSVKQGEAHPEWDTLLPSNTYSSTKACGEILGIPFYKRGEVKLIITNTMNNFGPWQSAKKFPVMVQRALERGEKVIIHHINGEIGSRFYLHSKRTARTLLDILRNHPPTKYMENGVDRPDKYHIVSNTARNNLEVAEDIAKIKGKKLDYELVDFHSTHPDHDLHYGLQNNKLKIEDDYYADMEETIKWEEGR